MISASPIRSQGHRSRTHGRRGPRVLAALTTLALLAGCGSATATRPVASATAPSTGAAKTSSTSAAPTTSTPASCAATVATTLGTVANRVYHEAATGGIVAQAVHRLQNSSALKSAVNSGNAAAAGAALRELTLGQIVRAEVLRGGRVLAQTGSGSAIAPARGSIPGTSATFVVSTQSAHSYLQVVHQVTGAQLVLTSGTHRLASTIGGLPSGPPAEGPLTIAGQSFQTATLTGAVYPSGTLSIALLAPIAGVSCPGSTGQTRVETLGHVGERIYQEELHSPAVAATVRHIEASSNFQHAVAAHDATAVRAAIVRFFGEHIHVVRVRVTTNGQLLEDLGGPYVLAPVRGTVRSGGRVVGQFEMAIQDDAGYLRLAHLFTGAEILMRTGARQVMGTLSPGPANVPARGPVSYGGHTYEAYSFTGEAFPTGPLRMSLLLPS
ncbi:MAG TPA: hypothetical protein VGI24_11155 [Solirubrobacteraceae bacterium]